ncbi:hypothetical protein PG995_006900 [Apiospora arundinis]|uniref:Aquaporin-like protein n=1 Tax=Apiospora arundinis TaxID=335852 RepID=A0ABR2JHX1_9PEZI
MPASDIASIEVAPYYPIRQPPSTISCPHWAPSPTEAMTSHPLEHVRSHDLELGATELMKRHATSSVIHQKPVSQRKLDFERRRPRWLRECLAEAMGVFLYVFPGVAATASFLINAANPLGVSPFGGLFQIGCAYAVGIAFAIITCAPVSGGHFNPAITLCFAFWQGFPWKKVPYYIFSQILGAFVAGFVMLGMYWTQIQTMKAAYVAAGKPLVGAGTPASILCSFPNPDQSNMGLVFLTEFFVDFVIGLVIWACIDPANPFVSHTTIPLTIGLAYAAMIWGFADITIAANMARDLGTRMVAAIFFGRETFTHMNYSPVAILANIPATFCATAVYELLMRDSMSIIGKGHAVHEDGDEGLLRHFSKSGMMDEEMIRAQALRRVEIGKRE